jgi:TonB family protein
MKKLLLILLCLPIIGFGQAWKYSSGGNDFDGKYRTSSVIGTGNDYPYNSPTLVVNFFENKEQINFYISDAGYYSSSSNIEVLFSFSNDKGNIYKSMSTSSSADGKIVFLGSFFHRDNIFDVTRLDIFKKLMAASYVNIRVSNDYGQNDIRFNLSGSTKAIKYVIPNLDKLIIAEEESLRIEFERYEIEDTESDEDVEIEIEEDDGEEFFMVVENMPEFPGGDLGLMKYIQKNLKYPAIAKEYNITGKVYVSFIVDKLGSVTNVKIVRGVEKNLDAEAIRLVKSLPEYKPGTQRGKAVRVMFTIPINFTLN